MSIAFEPADIRYVAYIDEAGDPGLTRVRPMDAQGATEWLSIGAILIQQERERETVQWVRSIREFIGARQRPDLHFRDLSPSRKFAVCTEVPKLPLRCFALLSNKKNMRQYRNERVERARPSGQQWFYNWCIRLLLERITDFVEKRAIERYGAPKHVQLIFSERGGVRYGQTSAYHALLRDQARSQTTLLKKREIKWRVLHPASTLVVPHAKNAGVQLADVVASSFYQAANTTPPPDWNTTYAKELKRVVPTENGSCADYGVTLQPGWHKAQLTLEQQEIFRFYGYPLK
jgi:Protein of unknown function (DUF3800)